MSKYYSVIHPENKPVKAIHIASRYKESFWAKLKIFSLKEFHQDSKILKIINSNRDNKHILNLYPVYDSIWLSSDHEELTNAYNKRINTVGHTRILFSKEVLDEIVQFIG